MAKRYFINEVDRPHYRLVEHRGFFDKELPTAFTPKHLKALVDMQVKALQAQLLLMEIYNGGDRPKVEIPEWLERLVIEADDKPAPQATEAPSSKQSHSKQSKKGSS